MSDDNLSSEEKESKLSRILSIFRLPYSQRDLAQHQEAVFYMREIKFFSSQLTEGVSNDEFLQKCTGVMQLMTVSPGTALYHQGDLASNIYILIEGKARRYIPCAFDELVPDERVIGLLNSTVNRTTISQKPLEENSLRKSILNRPKKGSVSETARDSRSSSVSSVSIETIPIRASKISSQSKISRKLGAGLSNLNHLKGKIDAIPPNFAANFPDKQLDNRKSQTYVKKTQAISKVVESLHPSILIMDCNEKPNETADILKDEKQNSKNCVKFDDFEVFSKFPSHIHKYFMNGAFRFKHSKTYTSGEVFGELGLAFGSARIATVVAETICHLLTIDRDNFNRILDEEMSCTKDSIEFIQQVFPQLSNKHISAVASHFKRVVYFRNQIIYKQDDPVDGIYLIREGEICFKKSVIVEPTPRRNKEHLMQLSGIPQEQIKTLTLGTCEFFGEEQLLKQPSRLYTAAIATNKAVVFKIPKPALAIIKKSYPDILIQLIEQAALKQEWRTENQEHISHWIQKRVKEVNFRLEPEETKAMNIIQKMSLVNVDSYGFSKNQQIFPRISTQDENFVSEEVMRDTDRAFYKEMEAIKPKVIRNRVKIRHMVDALSPEPKIKQPTSSRLWKASLEQQNTSLSRMLLHKRQVEEDEAKKMKLPDNTHEKKRHPLQALQPHLKKAVSTKSQHALLSQVEQESETANPKESQRAAHHSNFTSFSINISNIPYNSEEQKTIKKLIPPDESTSVLFSVKSFRAATPETDEYSKNQDKLPASGKNLPTTSRKKHIKSSISISTSLGGPDESHENQNLPVIGVSSRFLSPTPSSQLQDSENQQKNNLSKDRTADFSAGPLNPIKRRMKSLSILQNKHNIPNLKLNVSPTWQEKKKDIKTNETLLVNSLIMIKSLK